MLTALPAAVPSSADQAVTLPAADLTVAPEFAAFDEMLAAVEPAGSSPVPSSPGPAGVMGDACVPKVMPMVAPQPRPFRVVASPDVPVIAICPNDSVPSSGLVVPPTSNEGETAPGQDEAEAVALVSESEATVPLMPAPVQVIGPASYPIIHDVDFSVSSFSVAADVKDPAPATGEPCEGRPTEFARGETGPARQVFLPVTSRPLTPAPDAPADICVDASAVAVTGQEAPVALAYQAVGDDGVNPSSTVLASSHSVLVEPSQSSRVSAPAFFSRAMVGDLAPLGHESLSNNKNTRKDIAVDSVKGSDISFGTERARDPAIMPPLTTIPAATPIAPVAGGVASAPVTLPAATTAPVATLAVQLVERVGEIAEHVTARPAEQIRVELDLPGGTHVEIRVALRAGRVHADFRTDSVELREALAQAWEGFARLREVAGAAWAEPVFAPATTAPATVSASNPTLGAFVGQETSEHRASPDRRETASESRTKRTASMPATVEISPVIPFRRDESRLLSAVA